MTVRNEVAVGRSESLRKRQPIDQRHRIYGTTASNEAINETVGPVSHAGFGTSWPVPTFLGPSRSGPR